MSWGAIYNQSWWGRAIANDFGDVYSDEVNIKPLLKAIQDRSTYYENEADTTALLQQLEDCRLETTYGPELITNGDFSEQGSWSESGGSLVVTISNGEMSVNAQFTAPQGVYQNVLTEVGRTYRVEAQSNSHVTNALVRVTNGSIPSTGFGDYLVIDNVSSFEFTAIGTTTNLYLRNTTVGTTIWNNVSVKEIIQTA